MLSVIGYNQWPHLNRCYAVTHCMLSQYLASWATLGWLGTAISHTYTTFAARFADSAHRESMLWWLAWKMIWFSLLTSNQYTRNQKQINKYTTYTVFTYIITWLKTGTFGIHNTYMISELNYRLSWDAMTTKWSSGFRLHMIWMTQLIRVLIVWRYSMNGFSERTCYVGILIVLPLCS